MKLYVIKYIGDITGEKPTIEGVTNNPDLWLEHHNNERIAEGNDIENKWEFEFTQVNYEERTEENTKTLKL